MAVILVIDDDAQIRLLLRRILEKEGHQVYEAADGTSGMSQLKRIDMDLVITDIIMPEKEGLETILDIRHEFPDMKIIAISGGGKIGLPDFLPAAKKFGAHHTLPKPFGTNELMEAVNNLLAL
jgi:DNA-binding NtrC family response regulator